VVSDEAIDHGVGAGAVVSDHASEGGAVSAGGVGPDFLFESGEPSIQIVEHDAGLDRHLRGLAVEGENLVHVSAEIEDDAGSDGFASESAAPAPGDDGNMIFGGVLHDRNDILGSPGENNGEGLDLIDAGVTAVESQMEGIGENIGMNPVLKVRVELFLQSRAHTSDYMD